MDSYFPEHNKQLKKLIKNVECLLKECKCHSSGPSPDIEFPRHNDLMGLQGGDVSNKDFYHLSKSQYEGIVNFIENVSPPNYELPLANLSGNFSLIEVGALNSYNYVASFVQRDAGPPTAVRIYRNSVLEVSAPSYTDPNPVQAGITEYKAEYDYGLGPVKKNDIGLDDPTGRITPGTVSSSEVSIKGIIPWFWQTFDVLPDLNNLDLSLFNKEVKESTGTVRASLNVTGKFIVFLIPDASPVKTKWYVTELNRGDIEATGFILPPITKTLSSPNSYWNNEDFKVYVSDYLSDINPILELRNN